MNLQPVQRAAVAPCSSKLAHALGVIPGGARSSARQSTRMHKAILTAAFAALTAGQALLMPAPARSQSVAAQTVDVAAQATGPTGSALQLTLGLTPFSGDPDECGSSTDLEVNVGDQVNVCYTLTNNSADTLAFQSITDSVDGAILTFEPISIAPGESHPYVRTIVATGDTTRTASWTGYANVAAYAFDDSATPDFIDISTTGTDLGFVAGDGFDNEIAEYTADFPIRFYGQTSTALCISIDGLIQYADPDCIPPSGQDPPPGYSFNQDIPSWSGTEVPAYLAPMWMNMGDGPGSVYVQTIGSAPDRQLVVQWNDLDSYAIATSTATFEVVFNENSDSLRYEYRTTAFGNAADDGAWSTVGMQADPNGLYTKYSYYQASLHADSAIHWEFSPAVSASAQSGPAHLDAGVATIAVDTPTLDAVVGPDGTATRTLTIGNVGERDLHWNVQEAPGGSAAHFPRHPRHVAAPRESASATRAWSPLSQLSRSPQWPQPASFAPWSPAGAAQAPAFGTSDAAGFIGLDAADPVSSFSIINDDVSNWIYAASFIDNDFSRLYAIVYDSWIYPSGTYGTIDVASGAFTPIGTIDGGAGYPVWSGLTQDPLTGTVYVVRSDDNPFAADGKLYTLNLDSGVATLVGDIDGPGINPVRFFPGIAISPEGLMYGLDLYGQSLVAIDKQTGEARIIDSVGLNVQGMQDLEFDQQTGELYWGAFYYQQDGTPVGEMRVIDPASAASQGVGVLPPSAGYPATELNTLAIAKPSVGCAAPGDVPWLAVDPGNGIIAAGAPAQDVTVSFDGNGLQPGLYQATLCVLSDDPQHPAVAVPVSFAINDGALYDQNTSATSFRAFNNTVTSPAEVTGMSSEGADDFVVTDANGWSVSSFSFSAYGSSADNPLPTHVDLRILADDGAGRPGNVICAAPGLASLVDPATNQIGVWLPSACELSAGTYWVAWSFADVNIASPIIGLWGQIAELHNQPAVWHNPGGMLSPNCTAWSTFDQCPDQNFDPAAKDFGFTVFGSGGGNACGDIVFGDGFDGGSGGCTKASAARRD